MGRPLLTNPAWTGRLEGSGWAHFRPPRARCSAVPCLREAPGGLESWASSPPLSLLVATTVFGWRRPPPLGYSLYAIKLQDAQAADLAYTAQVSDAVTRKADDIHDTRIPCGNTMTIHVGMVRYV